MTIYRAILATSVTAMMGFVGGVWFVGTGMAFEWIKPPAIPPARLDLMLGTNRETLSRWRTTTQTTTSPQATDARGGSSGLIRAERDDLLPSVGCTWEVEPHRFRLDAEWHRTNPERVLAGFPLVEPCSDRLRYVLVQMTSQMTHPIPLRVVLFDGAAKRYVARMLPGESSRSSDGIFEVTRCLWHDTAPVDPSKIQFFGVERMIPGAASVREAPRQPSHPAEVIPAALLPTAQR